MFKGKTAKVALAITLTGAVVITVLIMILTQKTVEPGETLKVTFLDVGKGDSIFCQLPDGRNILIDAGYSDVETTVAEQLSAQGISQIDILIATHPHKDHIGGMAEVVDTFTIGVIVMPEVPENQLPNDPSYYDFIDAIERKNCVIKYPRQGEFLIDEPDTQLQIISRDAIWDDLNNYSIVARLTYGKVVFLFEGDAQTDAEQAILDDGYDVRADVLKVGHHGSSTSTSGAFLEAVSPAIGVISVGTNDRGLPTRKTLKKLFNADVKVLRTDIEGNIVILSDGVNRFYDQTLK